MYTEEEEFDYNDYLNDDSDNKSNKPFLDKGIIIKILIIIAILLVTIFVVFFVKNKFFNKEEVKEEPAIKEEDTNDRNLVFNNNLAILQNAAIDYFFKDGHYPKEIGETVKITVVELKENGYVTDIFDYDGKTCGYTSSYVSMTRNKNDYLLEIYLSCTNQENKVSYYYDLDFNCLTCKGEDYNPSDDSNTETETKPDSDTESDNNTLVCSFGNWTTEYKADTNLERETRVLVKGYKDVITYGEWSQKSETPIQETDNLEVRVETGSRQVQEKNDWSSPSTSKPSSKSGREIKSYSEKVPYSYTDCQNVKYTVNKKTWDKNALSCVSKGIGNVTCTYQKKVCDTKTGYNTKIYYQYRDTVTKIVSSTYYSSREKIINTVYTDYMLESELPSGYTKLPGSERIEYRYKEICGK